ncbi:MAG TPA: PLP-dependent aminotransferase family protein [Candidatus Blautia faecipullorum]|nr:PLP-dependent aminotransferase family protein [Candidatus Blautia faecipullorum]
MVLSFHDSDNKERLYLQVYHYYRELIMSRRLPPGSRMPSLRTCARDLHLSRTTIESAYLQLAADGYIISRAQSGYYVTDIAEQEPAPRQNKKPALPPVRYNFVSSGVDRESFRFDLWQRYLKSALRQNERLLSYGEPQGEADFRQVLSEYVRERRNVTCSPDDIVIGAGVQSLLHILCPLVRDKKTVSFPTSSFIQGSTVFSDYGFEVRYRNKDSGVIYVSPAHMTKWGEIMPVSRRLELLRYAGEHQSLIIEDDFENDFVYLQKPTPSLFSLAGGHGVVYIGSFSRLLLPSIRISFMILPPELSAAYQAKAACYNQTASKAEQIALCQFIRDGHLAAQTRRLKRLYSVKMKQLLAEIQDVFGKSCRMQVGAAGTALALTVSCSTEGESLKKRARAKGLRLEILEEKTGEIILLLSCSAMPAEDFRPACELLKSLL